MTTQEYLLAYLAEECCEVAQAVSKSIRFGLSHKKSGVTENNKERIISELNDVMSVIQVLVGKGILPLKWQDALAQTEKREKIYRYLDYSKKLKTVHEKE